MTTSSGFGTFFSVCFFVHLAFLIKALVIIIVNKIIKGRAEQINNKDVVMHFPPLVLIESYKCLDRLVRFVIIHR